MFSVVSFTMEDLFKPLTSTPNTSQENALKLTDSDVLIMERSLSPPLLLTDSEESLANITSTAYCDCGSSTREQLPNENFCNEVDHRRGRAAPSSSKHGASSTQDNIRAASADSADSAASDATRLRLLENKLYATTQILKNKEETIRVQAESLELAEARINALTSKTRASKTQQTQFLNTRSSSVGNHTHMTDVSSTVNIQEVNPGLVRTLRDNLSVIEELYRECFYETAKQEELIIMLRRSYLDMKLENRQEETQHIWQKKSMERNQDIALEVEQLKSEIANFLNSSTNNDSGVWEGEGTEGELRLIADQLRRLMGILHSDCTCGLEEENNKLKRVNESLEIQVHGLQKRIVELEDALEGKQNDDCRYQEQITQREEELQKIRHQLFRIELSSRQKINACDTLTLQVKELEALLSGKTTELNNAQQQCESHEDTIKKLQEDLQRAENIARENTAIRAEVCELSAQVSSWREQLAAEGRRVRELARELQRARLHCRHLAEHYKEKSETARSLQSQLCEAQSRGAELCAQAQRAVCGVRRWLKEHRYKYTQQEETIKQQEILIRSFRSRNSNTESASDEPCCSRYLRERQSDTSRTRASDTASTSYLNSSSRHDTTRASETAYTHACCEEATCTTYMDVHSRMRVHETTGSKCTRASETDSPTPPTPPIRLFRKNNLREERMSSPEELLERVERAHRALEEARVRWSSRHPRP